MFYKYIQSPLGKLKLIASDSGLIAVLYNRQDLDFSEPSKLIKKDKHHILIKTEKELNEYFNGARKTFTVPLEMIGTKFQKSVWRELRKIPFGKTRSYGEIAKRVKNPKASRAVGSANGQNPISIIVPCHRVIGSNGKLTGYAGGLNRKDTLLKLEEYI